MKESGGALKNAALIAFGVLVALVVVELGLRGAAQVLLRAHSPPRLDGAGRDVYRILCLGESTTIGTNPKVAVSYPAQLEQILNERSGSRRFRVINGGIPATRTDVILNRLPLLLKRYSPDVVVTMMGINDGPLADPLFAVSQGPSLRIWKLIRMLYFVALERVTPPWEGVPGDEPEGEIQVVEIPRGLDVPRLRRVQLLKSSILLREGDHAAAEQILLSLTDLGVEGDMRHITTAVYGQLMVLQYQRGRDQEGDRYLREFRELMDRHNPRTTTNYRALQKLLESRKIPLVAVQYPGRPIGPLKQILGPGPVYVDNEGTFLHALKTKELGELYTDLFAGNFGHLTHYGNSLLAGNVADAILRMVGDN